MMDADNEILDENPVVPRSRLFVLLDGTFVVRWTENDIQELQTGQYRVYDGDDYGAPITDYELNQLKNAGIVEKYDKDVVWLRIMPEHSQSAHMANWEHARVRSYYLNTTLPGALVSDVEKLLEDLGLSVMFQPRVRDDFVVLWATKGTAFAKFDDAEKARHLLTSKSPEAFMNTVIAFVETTQS